MKPAFSLDQTQFYYPGQEIRVNEKSSYVITGEEFKNIEKARIRLIFIAIVFAFLFCAVLVRLFEYTVLGEAGGKSPKNDSQNAITSMQRADIVDRNGILMATMIPVVDLEVETRLVDDIEEVTTDIVGVLPKLEYQTVKQKLLKKNSEKNHNIVLYRDLIPKQKYDINHLGHPALKFKETVKRIYPQDNLFSHILGGVNIEEHGIAGIELALDKEITSGHVLLELSLDVGVQYSVREVLAEAIAFYKAIAGVAIIMDVNTSEIIAMVSLPDFDPNNPPASSDSSRFNRASLAVYEFGSVFKIFNTALALESGLFTATDKIDNSQFTHKKRLIKDDHPLEGPLNLAEILAHSSNTASARMALKIGTKRQYNFFKALGFTEKTSAELSEKGKPILPRYLNDNTLISNAFGYEISVTPIHLITAVSAVVNGGIFRPATLLKQMKIVDGVRVISDNTSLQMRKMLRQVVLDGSGKLSEVSGYEVAGKTGTAEKVVNGKFKNTAVRSTFVSVFPASEPKYAMLVMLDEPKAEAGIRGRSAAANAVPTTKKLLEKIAPQLNLAPNIETLDVN